MFKKRLNKKAGVETKLYFFILQAVLLGFILLAFSARVFDIANNTLLEKNYFSRDVALLINTMYAAPGNVDYTYEGDFSHFAIQFPKGVYESMLTGEKYDLIVDFSPYKVKVYEKEEENEIAVSYPFMEDRAMELEYKELFFEEGEKVRFIKEVDKIKIGKAKDLQLKASKLACPEIETKTDGRKLTIDFNDEGKEKLYDVANGIKSLATIKNLDIALTRRQEERTIDERIIKIEDINPDIVISLATNNEEKLTVKSFISSEAEEELQKKSKKLACLITNKIIENLNDFEISAVKSVSKEPTDEDVLIDSKISIILEIGNLQNEDFFEKTGEITSAIVDGIGDYYEK